MFNAAGNFRASRHIRLQSARFPIPAIAVFLLVGGFTISGCGGGDAARHNETDKTLKQVGLAPENSDSVSPDSTVNDDATGIGRDAEKAADVRGELGEFHHSPDGDVDGITLKDGTLIRFPSNAGSKVTEMAAIGDQIEIIGWTHAGESEVHAATIKNAGSGNTLVVDQAPPNILNDSARK
jgi:hypothetical protein